MAEEKTNINYTAEDIQHYFSGKLPAAEMHAMEKAALDDPFLAEAMEGFALMKKGDTEAQLAILRKHFLQEKEAKVIPLLPSKRFNMWKMAAAVLVICGGLAITYLFTRNNGSGEPTLANLQTPEADTIPLAQTATTDSTTAALIAQSTPPTEYKKDNLQLSKQEGSVLKDTAFMYQPALKENNNSKDIAGGGYTDDALAKTYDQSTTNNAAPASPLNSESRNEQIATKRASENELTGINSKSSSAVPRQFIAQVVSPDNKPLPFANVTIPADNVGTYADAKGNFKFISSDSLLNVEIKSAGYLTRNYMLRNNNLNEKIVLEPDNVSLKGKTVVSGNSTSANRSRKAMLQVDTSMDAAPADGWYNYDTYVTNNLDPPQEVLQQKVHGEVEVSFEVQNNGTISDVKVDRSLCGDCDEEVLRLIKEGPKWKVTKGKRARAKLKVKF